MANLICRMRSLPVTLVAVGLLVTVSGAACVRGSGVEEHSGSAFLVRFDGVRLGVGGGSAYPRTTCAYATASGPPTLITRDDRWCCGPDIGGDWMVPDSGGTLASLRLELRPEGDPPARVEFSIGSTVYRSDASSPEGGTSVRAQPPNRTRVGHLRGWAGRVVFTDLPLVSGEPYDGRDAIGRLAIEWECRAE